MSNDSITRLVTKLLTSKIEHVRDIVNEFSKAYTDFRKAEEKYITEVNRVIGNLIILVRKVNYAFEEIVVATHKMKMISEQLWLQPQEAHDLKQLVISTVDLKDMYMQEKVILTGLYEKALLEENFNVALEIIERYMCIELRIKSKNHKDEYCFINPEYYKDPTEEIKKKLLFQNKIIKTCYNKLNHLIYKENTIEQSTKEEPKYFTTQAEPMKRFYMEPKTEENEKEKKMENKKVEIVKIEVTEVAKRVAAKQLVKAVRDPLAALMARNFGVDSSEFKGRIANFLGTDLGFSLVAALLSVGIGAVPIGKEYENLKEKLSQELRVQSMSTATDLLADVLIGPLRDILSSTIKDQKNIGLLVENSELEILEGKKSAVFTKEDESLVEKAK